MLRGEVVKAALSADSETRLFQVEVVLDNKEHLLKSLTPLYIGRTASFVIDTKESGAEEVEEKIERLCMLFEGKKYQLLADWR